VSYGSRQLRLLQSGQVGSYVLLMVLGMLAGFCGAVFPPENNNAGKGPGSKAGMTNK
jgi:uncharacterized membrane protein